MTHSVSPHYVKAPSFVRALAAHGDRVALLTPDATVTYRELSARVERVSAQLSPEGGRRLVLVGARNSLGSIEAYLGALAAGHVVLLVDGENEALLERITATYVPDVVIRPESSAGNQWAVDERHPTSVHNLHPDLALLLTTSGSTGSPKLVRLSSQNIESNAASIAQYLGLDPSERAMTTLPMHYCYGLSVIHSHLSVGASLVVNELSVVDECFWDNFNRFEATSFAGVPYTFEMLERVRFASRQLPTLRYATQAGGRLDPERVRSLADLGNARGWDFFVMYGQTEATARMAYLPPALAAAFPQSIGLPIPGGSFRIEPLPDAEIGVGELVYRGPNVMLGYATRPADLALGRTVDELHTGDVARVTSNGLYEIVGRRSAFAKIRGLRIDLEQAERNLAECGIAAVCAGTDETLHVAVATSEEPQAIRSTVVKSLGLPPSAVRVACVDALPRLPSGKVDRARVVEVAADAGRTDDQSVAARGQPPAADDVRRLYSDVMDRPARDSDTFVTLGGDSLSYVQVSLGLEQIVGQLPARWPAMTVAQLQQVAKDQAAADPEPRKDVLFASLARIRQIETSVVLRAIAIVLIVATHIEMVAIPGGAHLLLAVAGFNFARFQLTSADRLLRVRSQVRAIGRVVVPATIWIGALLLLATGYDPHSLLLLNAVLGPAEWNNGWQFWFIEVLTYLLLAAALFTAVPMVDRVERRRPFAVALAVLSVGLVLRFGVIDIGVPNTLPALWLFALGWAAQRADRAWKRVLVVGVAAVALPGFFGDFQREAVIFTGFALLVFRRSLPIPALLAPVAGLLASSSLYIYLVHWRVFPELPETYGLALIACLAAGITAWIAVDRAWPMLRAASRRAQAALVRALDGQPAAGPLHGSVAAVAGQFGFTRWGFGRD